MKIRFVLGIVVGIALTFCFLEYRRGGQEVWAAPTQIRIQGFNLIDDNEDGILEAIDFDFQLSDQGATRVKRSTDAQVVGFFQKAYNLVRQ